MEQLNISGYCKIRNGKIFLNDSLVFQDDNAENFSAFIKNAYKSLEIGYAKFFKMDNLSKLGFLTADILLKNRKTSSILKPEDTGIVLTNSTSSLDTDFTYFDSIKDRTNYFPSPSVFVYTLPNIMIGEICIKHKITGESLFLISEKFDPEFIFRFVSDLFVNKKIENCLTGWVDLIGAKYDSVLYIVEKTNASSAENINFDIERISEIYNK